MTRRRQGPRHPWPENTERQRQRGRTKGRRKDKEKKRGGDGQGKKKGGGGKGGGAIHKSPTARARKQGTPETTPARRGPSKQRAQQDRPQENVRCTTTRPGGRPAQPGQEGHAHAHRHQSRGRPERGYVGVHTKQPRCPPGTTPSWGPERVQSGARPAPLPQQAPAAGTKSLVLGQPPRAPRSHPVKPRATAPGLREGTTAMGKPTGAPRATGPDETRRTNTGPRGTPQRQDAGHNHSTKTGVWPGRPLGAANRDSRHNTRRTAAREKVPRTAGPQSPHIASTASGKRAPAAHPKGREVGGGRAPVPGRPTPRQGGPPPGALVPPPQRAKPARKSARCGVGDGSPRLHPPHPQPVCSGPRPRARKDEWSGPAERLTRTPHTQARGAPLWAFSCRPHSVQSQLGRAGAVGLVMGYHAGMPRYHSQRVVGPGRTPERTSGRGGEGARPRTPHTQARGAPPRAPSRHPTAPKASSQERALWGW